MKIKEGYILKEIAGSFIVVAVGSAALDFNGVITLNETGAFLWKVLSEGKDEAELITAMMGEYEIDEQTAKADIAAFLKKLSDEGLLA